MKNVEENNDSFGPWSFREKEVNKINELNIIDKITQKVNQTLLNSISKKKIIIILLLIIMKKINILQMFLKKQQKKNQKYLNLKEKKIFHKKIKIY